MSSYGCCPHTEPLCIHQSGNNRKHVTNAPLHWILTTSHLPTGFGFVTFDSEEPAEKVCSIQYHDIKGKKVEVKVAQTKEALAMQGRGRMVTRNFRKSSLSLSFSPLLPLSWVPAIHQINSVSGCKALEHNLVSKLCGQLGRVRCAPETLTSPLASSVSSAHFTGLTSTTAMAGICR